MTYSLLGSTERRLLLLSDGPFTNYEESSQPHCDFVRHQPAGRRQPGAVARDVDQAGELLMGTAQRESRHPESGAQLELQTLDSTLIVGESLFAGNSASAAPSVRDQSSTDSPTAP